MQPDTFGSFRFMHKTKTWEATRSQSRNIA